MSTSGHQLPSIALVLLFTAGCSGGLGQPAPAEGVLYLDGLPVETGFDSVLPAADSLDGDWMFTLDTQDMGEEQHWEKPTYDHGDWGTLAVPGTWNRAPSGELEAYEGIGWYARTVDIPALGPEDRLRFHFGACFLTCTYWLDGTEIGHTQRPYLPIQLDATDAVTGAGEHLLVVRVDSRITDTTVPTDTSTHTGSHGWWPYGGLTRETGMRVSPGAWIWDLTAVTEPDGEPDALSIQLGVHVPGDDDVRLDNLVLRLLDPDGDAIEVWEKRQIKVPAGTHHFHVDTVVEGAERWSRTAPGALYSLSATLNIDGDEVEHLAQFGFREVGTDGERVTLDGQPAVLYAISRHEDAPDTGPWQSNELLDQDLQLLADLGANHIRPGHYPADPRWLTRLRDQGITITEEIPVYQWDPTQMADEALVEEAAVQLQAMIQRDRNNPAIVMWSLMNEVHSWDPAAGDFAAELDAVAHADTPERLTTFAMLAMPGAFLDEQVAPHVDVISANEYYGWYHGANEDVVPALEAIRTAFPGQPLMVGEFGAGAVAGTFLEGDPAPEPVDDHSYTEDWQAWWLDEHLLLFQELGWIAGVQPWVFADFHMEWNPTTGDPHPVELTNLKGLMSMERDKKMAFDTVSGWYLDRALD